MKNFFILLLLLTSVVLQAQTTPERDVTITGKVLDKDTGQPLEYATVSFTDPQGKIVTGGITSQTGEYKIDVPAGVYKVQFEFISFKTEVRNGQKLLKNTNLPTIALSADAASLNEVVIRAETTEVSVRLDKKVYNIGKDLTVGGATVSDALNNVPSVTVDVDGAIALRGNENVRILINGKPSAIAGFGSTDALRSLPADAIERVEVITSPSARYDAEGTAGILNIILKKEKTLGLNGSITANYGVPLQSNFSANINLRTDKFNIFNTTGVQYRKTPGNAFFENRYLGGNAINPLVTETRDYDRLNRGFNTNLGIEYYLSEKTSLTASGFLQLGNDRDITTNNTTEFDASNDIALTRIREEIQTERDTTYQVSLNYITKFNNDGHQLNVDLQYDNDKERQRSFITEENNFPVFQRLSDEDVISLEEQNNYSIDADYVLPIGENAQFEAGFSGEYEETINDYTLLEEIGLSGQFNRNDSLSNIFTYNENVTAVYSQYGNKIGKFSFLLGLRMENTQLKGKVDAVNIATDGTAPLVLDFDKNYLGLFPTVNITLETNERENFTLGYNRRINRPRGFFINPFPSRSSETNVFQGNPDLNPAYSSAFDLGYLRRWKDLTLTSSIYYQYETDAFERIQEDTGNVTPNGIPIIRTIPINLATNQRYGFELGILYNPTKWLRLNGSFNYFSFIKEGVFNNVDYGNKNSSYFARGSAKVTLPGNIDWQTNVFYRGPDNNAQTESEGILSLDGALSKDIIDDNATITFNVSDILNSRKRRSLTTTNTFISESEFQWRERQFNVSFTYRFNEKKQRQRPNTNGGGGDDFEG